MDMFRMYELWMVIVMDMVKDSNGFIKIYESYANQKSIIYYACVIYYEKFYYFW